MSKITCATCKGLKSIRGMGGTTRNCFACKGVGTIEEKIAAVSTIPTAVTSKEPETEDMFPLDVSSTPHQVEDSVVPICEEPAVTTDTNPQVSPKKKGRK